MFDLVFPFIALILAPFDSGKSNLIRHIVMRNSQKIAAVVIFAKNGRSEYEEQYSYINIRFVYDKFDTEILNNVIALGNRIKKFSGSEAQLLIIFDDFFGMGDVFSGKESENLITTLKHANANIVIAAHALQKKIPTLLRNATTDFITFRNKEPNCLNLAYANWGAASENLSNKTDFFAAVRKLPKWTFLHCGKDSVFTMNRLAGAVPKFRLYLCPDDAKVTDRPVIFGNSWNYDLKPIASIDVQEQSAEEDDGEGLFVEQEDPSGTEDEEKTPSEAENEKKEDVVESADSMDELTKDFKEEKKKKKRKSKKQKEEEQTEAQEEEKPKKKQKKEKKEEPTLLEDIEQDEGLDEVLDKKQKIIQHRIRLQLNYIKNTPNNQDKILMDSNAPGFLDQDFNSMSYDELKKNWKYWRSIQRQDKVIRAQQGMYKMIENGIVGFTSKVAGTTNVNRLQIQQLLQPFMHDSILEKLGQANPYEDLKPLTTSEKITSLAGPMTSMLWGVYQEKVEGEATQANLNKALDPVDVGFYQRLVDE